MSEEATTAAGLPPKEDYIQKRLNKILENRIDSDRETLDALTDLSQFYTENTLQSRRNLRSQIERRSLAINENFLAAFREVKLALDDICGDIDAVSDSVDSMKNLLSSTEAQQKELIQQANTLQEDNNKLLLQQRIATGFLSRFQLSVTEHQTLYGATRDEPITAEFFNVLDHVQLIHADCRTLLQSGYQTAALDIMEEMTLHQEAALERLYRWTQSHCRNVDANEIGMLVIQGMARLQERPVLFKYVIDEYSTARRSVVVRSFIDALTVGSSSAKPIEMLAHDPKRYIGDMFAYIHQILPVEKENLLMLSIQESASHLPTTDMAVYLLNSLYQIESVLTIYEYMEERLERLQAQSDAQLDTLTSEQASSLVANLNLGPIYTVLQSSASQIEQRHLQLFMSKLDSFLEMPEILLLPQVNLLLSGVHRATVQKRSFNVIVAIYKQIYERIHDPAGGFERPETVLAKTPEQVAELLCG
ncbi:hypothetical protein quinque_005309 [Culex quinquefasciatus]